MRPADMDALSDVLRAVQLDGAVYLDGTLRAPWSIMGRTDTALCASFLPKAERVLSFHFVTEGSCLALLPDQRAAAVRLDAGDLVVVPQGETHVLCSAADVAPVAADAILANHVSAAPGEIMSLRYGGRGVTTRLICGFLASDSVLSNPLLSALPRLFRIGMRGTDAAWLETSMRFAASEAALARAGGATVLGKLSELLFIEAVRRYTETLPENERGWLAGLRDRFVGRALSLMHARPAHPWTIDALGREVGLSRSALAQRFTALLGQPPMQYLARWRLQLAARQLRGGDVPLAVVAEDVGYESEAAFNRAFKREFGVPPATWRRAGGDARGNGAPAPA
jgi:AraC family transcriptional regulator, alkane utilization regulator